MRAFKRLFMALGWASVHRMVAASTYRSQELNSDALIPLRTHTISAPYVDSNLQNKFWDFGGDTIIDTGKYIRLTQDKPSQSGWLWSRSPLSPVNFQIVVEFNIDGNSPHLFGDGFAMWLTTERDKPGPVFGFKNQFRGVGIVFDTYANGRHPYVFPRVMALSGNGIESYNLAEDGANLEMGGCSVDIRRTSVASKAKLTYVRGAYLELQLHYEDWEQWETCFELHNVTVPSAPYVGFTAVTGDVSDNHDIISIESYSVIHKPKSAAELRAQREAAKGKKPKTHRASKGGSFFGSFFSAAFTLVKWVVIIAVIAAVIVAALRMKRKHDAKRF